MAISYVHGFVLLHLNLCFTENYFLVLFFLFLLSVDSSALIHLQSLKSTTRTGNLILHTQKRIVKNTSVPKHV